PISLTVTAPFVVTARNGRPLFGVLENAGGGQLLLRDRQNRNIFEASNLPGGRGISLTDSAGGHLAFLGQRLVGGGLRVRALEVEDEDGTAAVQVGHVDGFPGAGFASGLRVLEEGNSVVELGHDSSTG